jgi:serine/threonine-protein kinase RIO1
MHPTAGVLSLRFLIPLSPQGSRNPVVFVAGWPTRGNIYMKKALNELNEEDFEEGFVKFKSKKNKLTGRQSVTQLVSSNVTRSDLDTRFENPDLNELHHMDFLDELICGIKTGKEASVYLGRNSRGLVAVKMYTDLRVRSFKNDAAYRQGRFIGDARIQSNPNIAFIKFTLAKSD